MPNEAILAGLMLLELARAPAQQSESFQLEEHVFNAAGHPEAGALLTSTSFQMSLGALGEGVVAAPLCSASFQMEGGFASAYPPRGEVDGLRFIDDLSLSWDPEHSAGIYNLYRDLQSNLPGLGFGLCE